MAFENIYIAASIITVAGLGFFAYLHFMSKDEMWRTVWLSGATLMLCFGFGVIRKGFQSVVVDNALEALTFNVLDALIWMFVLLSGYLILQLCLWTFNKAKDVIKGKSSYEQDNETS